MAGSGEALPAGSIGEVITATFNAVTITTTDTILGTITVNPGIYIVTMEADAIKGTSTRLLGFVNSTSGTATVIFPTATVSFEWYQAVDTSTVAFTGTTTARVTAGGTINFTAKSFTANTTNARGRIQMIRIA